MGLLFRCDGKQNWARVCQKAAQVHIWASLHGHPWSRGVAQHQRCLGDPGWGTLAAQADWNQWVEIYIYCLNLKLCLLPHFGHTIQHSCLRWLFMRNEIAPCGCFKHSVYFHVQFELFIKYFFVNYKQVWQSWTQIVIIVEITELPSVIFWSL